MDFEIYVTDLTAEAQKRWAKFAGPIAGSAVWEKMPIAIATTDEIAEIEANQDLAKCCAEALQHGYGVCFCECHGEA